MKDYDDWLARVHGFVAWTDSAIDNFRKGMKAGVVLPKILVTRMIPQMRGKEIVVTDPTKSLSSMTDQASAGELLCPADKERLTAAYKKAIATDIVPTYRKSGRFPRKGILTQGESHERHQGRPRGT